MLCQFIAMLQELVNIWVIGQLNDPELLVAVGLGNVVINILGYGMFLGLNGALNTFVA
jgi:Na+-driven multidrug efflux pump